MTEQELEQKIEEKQLTAPRITPDDIDNTIIYREYWRVPNTTTTVCALHLRNGYVVIGKSASASMENFNEELGRQIAFDDAREQVWALEGYNLRQKLYERK